MGHRPLPPTVHFWASPPTTPPQSRAWVFPVPVWPVHSSWGLKSRLGFSSHPNLTLPLLWVPPTEFPQPGIGDIWPLAFCGFPGPTRPCSTRAPPRPLESPGRCHSELLFHSHSPAHPLLCLHTLPLSALTLLILVFAPNSSMPLPPGSLPCCLWLGCSLFSELPGAPP